ncbi:MAG: AAA family ATPase, partial [Pseudomonadota bacterium]
LPKTVETIYLAVPSLSRDEMLATIAGDLHLEPHGMSTTKLIRALQEKLIAIHAEGRQVVALIDEAHAMPLETLEEIRLLSNLETSHFKLMQIVLFGQPELDEHLSLQNMRQLRERITHSFCLQPLPPRDIKDYVDFRLRAAGYKGPELFTPSSLKLLAEASEGLTRRINIYCDKTLLAAYAAGTHAITPDLVRAAITDTQIIVPDRNKKHGTLWLAVAASLMAGMVIGFLAGRATVPEEPTAAPRALSMTPSSPVQTLPTQPALNQKPAIAPEPPTTGAVTGTIIGAQNITPPITIAAAPVATVSLEKTPGKEVVTPLEKVVVPKTEANNDWLGTRVVADMARLEKLPKNRFSIQLMSADEREQRAIESFLRGASRELNPDRIMVYFSGTVENPRVGVLYGNYGERSEASAELSGLPVKLTQFRPYVRSFQAVRDDLRHRP